MGEIGSFMELLDVACLKLGCVSIEIGCERYSTNRFGLVLGLVLLVPSLVYVPMYRLNKNELNGLQCFIRIIWFILHDNSILHYLKSMNIISSKLP